MTIAQRAERRIIGLMSGTSMDGLDIALCRITGHGPDTQVEVEQFTTIPFSADVKAQIREVFAKRTIDFQHLTLLNPWLGNLHAQLILDQLEDWDIPPEEIDIIASHGQTVFHAPRILHGLSDYPNATFQIGDGDHIAVTTGIITLSDFRQKHVAAGGEGAPLALYGDYFIFSDAIENRIMLNLGGIANFTFLPAGFEVDAVFVTDTGPGNTLMDALATRAYGLAYDDEAKIALSGQVAPHLLAELKADRFFEQPFPRTTGPELLNLAYLDAAMERCGAEGLSDADVMATLVQFSAETIAEALEEIVDPDQSYVCYMSGGGMHNPALTGALQALLPGMAFKRTDDLGISGDAKEAVLFAVLANETLAGGQTSFGNRAGIPSVCMGKISLPG